MGDSINMEKIEKLYQVLRNEEWRNDRTGAFDDKKMVERIERYLITKAREEVDGN